MKHILSLSVALLMACVAFAQNITDFYRPGGFDYNGASIKTFSVSDTTAVQFSRGNLQYNAALDKWRFALRQYSTACNDNANMAQDYDGWIDMFGWGTSGWNSGATAYQPWATSSTSNDYKTGGSSNNDLTGAYANADWGIYNKIENGGKFKGMWRTLTKDEWIYLLGNNTKRNGKHGMATLQGIYKGLVILPDDWFLPNGVSFTPGYGNEYSTNRYTLDEWQKMESAGAIFLPAAGERFGTELGYIGTGARYWSSTHDNESNAWYIGFYGNLGTDMYYGPLHAGRSVRLVRRVQAPLEGRVWVDMGLPSGTLWYSCNIGTTKPQGYGAYFAWGETKPKADYSWDTYKWGTAGSSLTKYCDNYSYGLDGYTDNLMQLEYSDDAARASMGGDARMPTREEWTELKNNCTGEWTTYKGVNGWMLTSKNNGNKLFLPAAGYRNGSALSDASTLGYYWTSYLLSESSSGAIDFKVDTDSLYNAWYGDRASGYSVRAVSGGTPATAQLYIPNGVLPQSFTVAEGRTVQFSKGNLQVNLLTYNWRFAENQYDYIGEGNANIAENYNGFIDLFGWGTSNWNSGANAYQPWATSTTATDYYPGGSYDNNLTGDYANADWGIINKIENGGFQSGMWRTLTKDEWEYLINTRSASTVGVYENARYAKATVNGVAGLIILPDSFTMPSGVTALDKVNVSEAVFTANVYTTADWAKLEAAGVVFLPAAGYRSGTEVSLVGTVGYYWSGTYGDEYGAYVVGFYDDNLLVNGLDRSRGLSVRLVKD